MALFILGLSNKATQQPDLFSQCRDNTALMQVMDRINEAWGQGMVRSGAEGVSKSWQMRRELTSPGYTMDCNQIPVVC